MKTAKLLLVMLFSIAVAACGGGGNGGETPSATYSISGTAIAGATLTLSGQASASVSATASGTYSFAGLANGSYTVTPSLSGYSFAPTSLAVNVSGADVSGVTFVATANPAPTYSISGVVTGLGAGVTIGLSPGGASTMTNASGNYSFTGLASGSYTVTPSHVGYSFTPTSQVATITNVNLAGVNFMATANPAPTYSISGTVSGMVSSGVTISLSPGTATAVTDTNGNYTLSGIVNGGYTVTPSLVGHTFTPSNASATVNGANVTGVNFTEPVPVLATGKLLYPCPGAICSKNLATGVESTVIATNAGTPYAESIIPYRTGVKTAYHGPNNVVGSGVYSATLTAPTSQTLAINNGYFLTADNCHSQSIGNFDLSQAGDFAAMSVMCDTSGQLDIFLVLMNGTGNNIRVTNDAAIDSFPVIGGVDAAGIATVLFISNKAGVIGIWKQLVNISPTAAPGTELVGTQTLVTNNVINPSTADGSRAMSINAAYTHLVFTKAVGGISHIFVKSFANGVEVDLGAGANPYWTLDGSNKILYTANSALWVINQDGTGKESVPTPTNLSVSGPAWGNDLAFVVFGPAGF